LSPPAKTDIGIQEIVYRGIAGPVFDLMLFNLERTPKTVRD
jgi:hypothetical protein